MPPYILEISGVDYSGKSTQAELLTFETHGYHVINYGGYSRYGKSIPKGLPPQDLFKWWFESSSSDELCQSLIDAYNVRAKTISEANNVTMAVVERGRAMLHAQLAASLAIRLYKPLAECIKTSEMLLNKYTTSTTANRHEIVLVKNNYWCNTNKLYERYTRSSATQKNNYTDAQNLLYKQYTAYLTEALSLCAMRHNCTILTIDRPAVDVQNIIRRLPVLPIKLPILFPGDEHIFLGLAGLSESGKGAIAEQLKDSHGFTRLKIGYFNEALRLGNSKTANPAKMALAVTHFLTTNRHINRGTIESLHGPELGAELKLLLGNRWKMVYFDVDEDTRLNRLFDQFPDSARTELEEQQKTKDQQKLESGILAYRDIADICLENNGPISETIDRLLERSAYELPAKA